MKSSSEHIREEFFKIEEGFSMIPGYERFDGRSGCIEPVPGVGPIIWCNCVDGRVFASRSDGKENAVYMATSQGWKMIGPV